MEKITLLQTGLPEAVARLRQSVSEGYVGSAALFEGLILVGLASVGMLEGVALTRLELTSPEPMGPGWHLFGISAALLMCGLIHLAGHARRGPLLGERRLPTRSRIGGGSKALVLLVLYAVVIPIVGYLLGTAAFLVLALRAFGLRSWIRCAILGVGLALFFWVGFSNLAQIQLP